MNKRRREDLQRAIGHLETAKSIIESASSEEQDCMDNMPENMRDGERYSAMEDAVDALDDALDDLDDVIESVERATA